MRFAGTYSFKGKSKRHYLKKVEPYNKDDDLYFTVKELDAGRAKISYLKAGKQHVRLPESITLYESATGNAAERVEEEYFIISMNDYTMKKNGVPVQMVYLQAQVAFQPVNPKTQASCSAGAGLVLEDDDEQGTDASVSVEAEAEPPKTPLPTDGAATGSRTTPTGLFVVRVAEFQKMRLEKLSE